MVGLANEQLTTGQAGAKEKEKKGVKRAQWTNISSLGQDIQAALSDSKPRQL